MDRTEISLEERKKIQLNILLEFDAFCKANDIKYSLAYGTLLGAIRHKGYIPWDDDIDVVMPLPDLLRFKKLYKSDSFVYCDIDTQPGYSYAFSRLANASTFSKEGKSFISYGINIDLYPMVGLPFDITEAYEFLDKCEQLRKIRLKAMQIRSAIIRRLPLKSIPFFKAINSRYKKLLFSQKYENATLFTCVGSPRKDSIFDRDLFISLIDVPFEGYSFPGFSDYDYYLKICYGDYMKLPPVEKRVPYHNGHYFWKHNN